MRTKFFISILTVVSAFLFVASSASDVAAQSPTGSSNFNSPECPQIAWSCAQVTDLDEGKNSVPHRQQLQQSGLPATDAAGNPTQFIIACGIDTDRGFLASTGNQQLDREYCLSSGEFNTYNYLQQNYGYSLQLQGFNNPFTSADGNIDKVVRPANVGDPRNHMCMIGWKVPVTTTGSENSGDSSSNPETANTYGLEYTTFTFSAGQASCISIYADPYGRTYNDQLKPVPGADVSLFDFDTKELISGFGIPNPVRTGNSGMFNFNVPPGRSYLQTSLANAAVADVHPNYSLAYTEPYTYGDLIVETLGNAEQRDIPVIGGGTPVLELAGYTYIRAGDHIMISGQASWPLTIVDLMQGTTSIMQMQSDKFGNFEFKVDPSKIDPKEELVVKLTEVDLTENPQAPATDPATDQVVLDPIPSYLEGYAYNEAGELVPFATVRIRLSLTDAIYYSTKADQNAYYSVAPRNLPIMPYYIEIIEPNALPGGGTITQPTQPPLITGPDGSFITTAPSPVIGGPGDPIGTIDGSVIGSTITIPTYAKQNQEYHDVNNVDIMAGTKNGTKVDPSAVADSSNASFGSQSAVDDKMAMEKSGDTSTDTSSSRYLTLLILVVLLIFVGTGAVLLLRKKNRPDQFGSGTDQYRKDDSQMDDMDNATPEPIEPENIDVPSGE